ncbi:MAG: sortase [Rubrobacteraceae bacterium]
MKRIKTRRRGGIGGALLSLVLVIAGLGLVWYALFGGHTAAASVPTTASMKLTIPEMSRVKDAPVYTAPASDESARNNGALHVQGTGYPWQSGANVYIAGHRLGYAGTGSYLLFFDLNKLKNGDELYLTDANGTRYTYRVFRVFKVSPNDESVTRPVPGKSIISLQTCTLPTYTQRLIVQGELVSVS